MNLQTVWSLLQEVQQEWKRDKASRLGAALAFYTMFSLAPLFVLVMGVAGLVFGQEAVAQQLYGQVERLVGSTGVQALQEFVVGAQSPKSNIVATIIGVVTLLFGATGVFGQLQDAINTVWGVQPKAKPGPVGILRGLRERFVSFAMVLSIGFLLLVSLVINTALAGVGSYIISLLPDTAYILVFEIINLVVSAVVITALFALIYKILPDAHVRWSDVWVGAAITAVLFIIGRELISIYLGSSPIGSAYGVVGSIIIGMIWVFYSTQILFFGAEFTQVYARRFGQQIVPTSNATEIKNQPTQHEMVEGAEG